MGVNEPSARGEISVKKTSTKVNTLLTIHCSLFTLKAACRRTAGFAPAPAARSCEGYQAVRS